MSPSVDRKKEMFWGQIPRPKGERVGIKRCGAGVRGAEISSPLTWLAAASHPLPSGEGLGQNIFPTCHNHAGCILTRMRTLIACLLTLGILAGGVTAQQPPRACRLARSSTSKAISTGRVTTIYFSLFMVTPEGIILADPINAAFATWMKELCSRNASKFR